MTRRTGRFLIIRADECLDAHSVPFRHLTLGIAHDRQISAQGCRELRVLVGSVETDIEDLDIEVLKLLGAVTLRREFSRSTGCDGSRKPRDDDTALVLVVGQAMEDLASSLEREVRNERTDLHHRGRGREGSPGEQCSEDRSDIHLHTFARLTRSGKTPSVLPKRTHPPRRHPSGAESTGDVPWLANPGSIGPTHSCSKNN